MTYILSALVTIGQAIVGLLWLIVLCMAAFVIADGLGFVAPVGDEKPNLRWQRRQQRAQRKLWGDSVITKRQLAKYIGQNYAYWSKDERQLRKLGYLNLADTAATGAAIFRDMAAELREGCLRETNHD